MRNGFYYEKDHLPDWLLRGPQLSVDGVRSDCSSVKLHQVFEDAIGGRGMSKVALILGVIGMLLGGGVLLVSILLPPLTDGRTSWDEAMIGIIPGALVLLCSFALALVGLIAMLTRRKKFES